LVLEQAQDRAAATIEFGQLIAATLHAAHKALRESADFCATEAANERCG
jgi:hypothetical protein